MTTTTQSSQHAIGLFLTSKTSTTFSSHGDKPDQVDKRRLPGCQGIEYAGHVLFHCRDTDQVTRQERLKASVRTAFQLLAGARSHKIKNMLSEMSEVERIPKENTRKTRFNPPIVHTHTSQHSTYTINERISLKMYTHIS